ncbi:MAG: class I SAM-dependent methyltransferase [Myxococcota bacterium]
MATSYLCPEIRLHLVTEECPLWRAREEDLEQMGLPSPFWALCWAGGEALARSLLDHPERVAGRRVLDFGAGGGVEAVAAARAGARVVAVDVDPLAARCAKQNAALNRLALDAVVADWVDREDLDFDVVLAGDVTYDPELARRVVTWLARLADSGVEVWVGDPGRGCLPEHLLHRFQPFENHRAPADNDRGHRSLVTTTVYRLAPS